MKAAVPPREHLRLPAASFYWAVLDAATVGRAPSGQRRRRLGFLFEEVLPRPIEDVQAAYAPAPTPAPAPGSGGSYVACGIPRPALDALLADGATDAVTLAPEGLPPFVQEAVGGAEIDAGALNLLTGAFEPQAVRAARRRLLLVPLVAVLVVTALVVVGFERRARHHLAAAAACDAARHAMIEDLLGPAPSAGGAQPRALRLVAERRRLEQTRRELPASARARDVTPVLAGLLRRWPVELELRTESIIVTPDAVTVRGLLQESGGVQTLVDRLDPLDGWTVQPPQVSSTRDGVRATVRLAPRAPAKPEVLP